MRYLLFSMQNAMEKGLPPETVPNLPDYFIEFWLKEHPLYEINARGEAVTVAAHHSITVERLGGYLQFAKKWDVDADLRVYIRFSSVWQEWNATLTRVVPVLGEGE